MTRTEGGSNKFQFLYLAYTTSFFVFIFGNALSPDIEAMRSSFASWIGCQAVIIAIAFLWIIIGNLLLSICTTLLILSFPVYLNKPDISYFIYVISLLGFLYFLLKFRLEKKILINSAILSAIAAAVILTADRYTTFDMSSRLAGGNVHLDTLYHASMAAMMKTYGVVSTGLNGLVETPYHVLAHALIASLSVLTGVPVLNSFGTVPVLLFAPLLLLVITDVSVRVVLPSSRASSGAGPEGAWLLACLGLILLPALFARQGLWASYFGSESYLVSLIIFLPVLPVLCKPVLSPWDWGAIAIAGGLAVLAKGSVGVMLCALMLARLFFISSGVRALGDLVAAGLLGVVVGFLALKNATSNEQYIGLEWFHFIRNWGGAKRAFHQYIASAGLYSIWTTLHVGISLIYFYFAHFVMTWLALLVWTRRYGWTSVFSEPWPLFVAATASVGIAATLVLKIPAGSLYYISNIAMFCAAPLAIALYSGTWLTHAVQDSRKGLGVVLLVLFVVAPVQLRSTVARETVGDAAQIKLIQRLQDIRDHGAKNVIFEFHDTWDSQNSNPFDIPQSRSLFYPAVSERAWLGAIDKNVDCGELYRGFLFYRSASTPGLGLCFDKQSIPTPLNVVEFHWDKLDR